MTQPTICKRRPRPIGFAALSTLLLGAACAATPSNAEQRALFLKYSRASVDGFTYLGRYQGMRQLGKQQFVIWTTINDAYLISVQPPCVGLEFVNNVRLTSTAHTVTRGVDGVVVEGQKCMIKEIRPVDYLKMKQETHAIP